MALNEATSTIPAELCELPQWVVWRPEQRDGKTTKVPYRPGANPGLRASSHEGGEGNPLGARALYLGSSLYRIHGTNEPDTIGDAVTPVNHPAEARALG